MLSLQLIAGGTGVISASFTDEDGNAVVPNALAWTLLQDGNVVNNREDVTITTASTINIILSGADLIAGTSIIIVEGNYDSSYGSSLPLKQWDSFQVIDAPHEI